MRVRFARKPVDRLLASIIDGFCLFSDARTKKATGLNGSGRSPGKLGVGQRVLQVLVSPGKCKIRSQLRIHFIIPRSEVAGAPEHHAKMCRFLMDTVETLQMTVLLKSEFDYRKPGSCRQASTLLHWLYSGSSSGSRSWD